VKSVNCLSFFFNSSSLEGDYKKKLMEILEDNQGLGMIDFENLKPYWIFRKYLLELAILTIFSDKEVHTKEKYFLKVLSEKLELNEDEVDASFIAIETFVLENGEQAHYLKRGKMMPLVATKLMNTMKKILSRNMVKVSKEIKESKELIQLLYDSKSRKLTREEQEIVRLQLIDILKCVPIFVIIALPGTFLTLPLMLKILPDSVFPDSFHDNKHRLEE